MNFVFKKDSGLPNPVSSRWMILPDVDDEWANREVDCQRLRWKEFLKSHNIDFSETWLWQNWKKHPKNQIRKKFMGLFSSKMKSRKKLKALIRAGVPPELRGKVWWACSGADNKRKEAKPEEQYSQLVQHIHELDDTSIAWDIEKDLRRTFPEIITMVESGESTGRARSQPQHCTDEESITPERTPNKRSSATVSTRINSNNKPSHKESAAGANSGVNSQSTGSGGKVGGVGEPNAASNAESLEMLNALRRVLCAYALRNPDVGYCQSMNYVCALILFHIPEEEAFWVMSALIEDLLPSNYYSASLIGGRVDQQVFQSCIAWKLPRLHEHFKATSTLLEPIICPWFLCLFINVLPIYAVCRVWDCMLWEGSTVLFRIGLCMLKSKAHQIYEAEDFVTIYTILKSGNSKLHSFEIEPAQVNIGVSNHGTLPQFGTPEVAIKRSSRTTSDADIDHVLSLPLPSPSPSQFPGSSSNGKHATAAAAANLLTLRSISSSISNISTNNLVATIPGSSGSNPVYSDTGVMIRSAFGYKWLRSVPKKKIEELRLKFREILEMKRASEAADLEEDDEEDQDERGDGQEGEGDEISLSDDPQATNKGGRITSFGRSLGIIHAPFLSGIPGLRRPSPSLNDEPPVRGGSHFTANDDGGGGAGTGTGSNTSITMSSHGIDGSESIGSLHNNPAYSLDGSIDNMLSEPPSPHSSTVYSSIRSSFGLKSIQHGSGHGRSGSNGSGFGGGGAGTAATGGSIYGGGSSSSISSKSAWSSSHHLHQQQQQQQQQLLKIGPAGTAEGDGSGNVYRGTDRREGRVAQKRVSIDIGEASLHPGSVGGGVASAGGSLAGSMRSRTTSGSGGGALSQRMHRRSRKSSLFLRALEEDDIKVLRELALQMHEGLNAHVEEFAKTLEETNEGAGSAQAGHHGGGSGGKHRSAGANANAAVAAGVSAAGGHSTPSGKSFKSSMRLFSGMPGSSGNKDKARAAAGTKIGLVGNNTTTKTTTTTTSTSFANTRRRGRSSASSAASSDVESGDDDDDDDDDEDDDEYNEGGDGEEMDECEHDDSSGMMSIGSSLHSTRDEALGLGDSGSSRDENGRGSGGRARRGRMADPGIPVLHPANSFMVGSVASEDDNATKYRRSVDRKQHLMGMRDIERVLLKEDTSSGDFVGQRNEVSGKGGGGGGGGSKLLSTVRSTDSNSRAELMRCSSNSSNEVDGAEEQERERERGIENSVVDAATKEKHRMSGQRFHVKALSRAASFNTSPVRHSTSASPSGKIGIIGQIGKHGDGNNNSTRDGTIVEETDAHNGSGNVRISGIAGSGSSGSRGNKAAAAVLDLDFLLRGSEDPTQRDGGSDRGTVSMAASSFSESGARTSVESRGDNSATGCSARFSNNNYNNSNSGTNSSSGGKEGKEKNGKWNGKGEGEGDNTVNMFVNPVLSARDGYGASMSLGKGKFDV